MSANTVKTNTVKTNTVSSTSTMDEVEQARTKLAATLAALEYKLNPARQLKDAATRIRVRVRVLRNRPGLLAGLAVGAVATVGAVGWLGIRALRNRR